MDNKVFLCSAEMPSLIESLASGGHILPYDLALST
jgi:hypothetical protein